MPPREVLVEWLARRRFPDDPARQARFRARPGSLRLAGDEAAAALVFAQRYRVVERLDHIAAVAQGIRSHPLDSRGALAAELERLVPRALAKLAHARDASHEVQQIERLCAQANLLLVRGDIELGQKFRGGGRAGRVTPYRAALRALLAQRPSLSTPQLLQALRQGPGPTLRRDADGMYFVRRADGGEESVTRRTLENAVSALRQQVSRHR